ncbi:unnamed protein product [Dicrocoelium dendriticum]|nr:unnamed protein product [Dicrocoelium dendriticum]
MKAAILLLVQLAAIHTGGHVIPLRAQKEVDSYKDSIGENWWNDTHTSGQIPDVSTEQREMGREVSTEDIEEFTAEMTETSAGSVKEYIKYNNKLVHGGMGRGNMDHWGEYMEASTEYRLPREEITTVGYDGFTARVTDELDGKTTIYPEYTEEYSDGEFTGEATDISVGYTGGSTEYWWRRHKVPTERFSELTDNVADVVNVNTKRYPEHTEGFSDDGIGGGITDEWGEYTDASTEYRLPREEITTVGYDGFTARVTDELDGKTTIYPEHTEEYSDGEFTGEATDISVGYAGGSTEYWWRRHKVPTEGFIELTDNVADVVNVNTKRYPEHTDGFSDGGTGGGTTEDWGEYTDASTEYRLPREEITTVGYDGFTARVTDELDGKTTIYPEHTDEFSGVGFGGEATDDSGVFSDESTESWIPGDELTIGSFEEFTGNVTNVVNVYSTIHPKNAKEYAGSGFGGGATDYGGETTEASTEYWLPSTEITTNGYEDFTAKLTEELAGITKKDLEHNVEIFHSWRRDENTNDSGEYSNVSNVE